MVNAQPLDVVLQAEVEDVVQLGHIKRVYGEPNSNADSILAAPPNGSHRAVEGTLQAAKFVVPHPRAVNTDSRILETHRRQPIRHEVIDQQAVGGERAGKTDGSCIADQAERIR